MKYYELCYSRLKNNALAADLLSFEIDDETLIQYEGAIKEVKDRLSMSRLIRVKLDPFCNNVKCWKIITEDKNQSDFNYDKNNPIYWSLHDCNYLVIYGLDFIEINNPIDEEYKRDNVKGKLKAYIDLYSKHHMELVYKYKDSIMWCEF